MKNIQCVIVVVVLVTTIILEWQLNKIKVQYSLIQTYVDFIFVVLWLFFVLMIMMVQCLPNFGTEKSGK